MAWSLQERVSGRSAEVDRRRPLMFFALVFVLTLPLYVLSPLVTLPGMPKNGPPLDFVGAFMPMTAALILTGRSEGRRGVRMLLRRALDFRRIPSRAWILPILLLMPAIYLSTAAVVHLTGLHVPGQPALSLSTMAVFVPVYFLAATGEELGWIGYATEPLWSRFGPVAASLIIGVPWWAWHIPSMLSSDETSLLIALGLFASLALRVIYVWIFGGTGSVAAAIAIHAVTNVSASSVPSVPTNLAAPLLLAVAVAIAVKWTRERRPLPTSSPERS
ncbi:type II CAAX endopeptidase family protein [Kribbella sp. NPDC051952]|uniref:CPBP family intramembrane glutamic endopeptidase n=1 Tax=Kribbella sp. NPDC051952 TaxID=3154851 RepID=UPI003442F89E